MKTGPAGSGGDADVKQLRTGSECDSAINAEVKKIKKNALFDNPDRGMQIHMHRINPFAEGAIKNLYKAVKSNSTKR